MCKIHQSVLTIELMRPTEASDEIARVWWFHKVQGINERLDVWQQRGVDAHDALEPYQQVRM